MLKAVLSRYKYFDIKVLPGALLTVVSPTQRFVSTNSAIRRGIRKSRPKTYEANSRSEYGRERSTKFSDEHRISSVDRRHAPPRERRPNHQEGFDVEDMVEQSGRARADKKQKQRPNSFQRPRRQGDSLRPFGRGSARYTDSESSSHNSIRGSSSNKRSTYPEPSKYEEYAPQGHFKKPGHYDSRKSSPGRHELESFSSLEHIRGKEETPRNQLQARRGIGSPRAPSFTANVRKPLTRAERRLALYGRGDTAPGGLPRSEVEVEENGEILRSASRHLRMAAKRREPRHLSEPGLEDELEYASEKPPRRMRATESDLSSRNNGDSWRVKTHVPLSIPYTTPASEFLYGTSAVFAALTAMRRKMYKLYVYSGENREAGGKSDSIQVLAHNRQVEVIKVEGDWLRLMDKLSKGRPHNGFILEASPLPKLPVIALERVSSSTQEFFSVSLDHQSAEEERVNGTDKEIKYKPSFCRYPFVLLLDGILDPGNLGALLRTALFLGVDAVAISSGHSAPISPVALKASAGACEALPLLSVANPFKFIDESRSKGWRAYAAVAPDGSNIADSRPGEFRPLNSSRYLSDPHNTWTYCTTTTLGCPTLNQPCILMLGSEGDGLRKPLMKKSDVRLSIEAGRGDLNGVDSLNVSVAAGLLCDAFLRPPYQKEHDEAKLRSKDATSQNPKQPSLENSSEVPPPPSENAPTRENSLW